MAETVKLDPSLEANGSDLQKRRTQIETYILKVMDQLDPEGDNSKRWKEYFKSLDMKGFARFMELLHDKKAQINIVMPNIQKPIKVPDIIKATEIVGVKTSHRLWLTDRVTGRKYLTPEKYMVVTIPIRRAQQEWDKKLMVPHRDTSVDMLTGQVMGDDAKCGLSGDEIRSLNARGLTSVMRELVKVRGGDVQAYGDLKRQMQETGRAELSKLNPNTRTRSSEMVRTFFLCMMIDCNI